jgi:membrane protease subunit (stomatin/prohibitin family)
VDADAQLEGMTVGIVDKLRGELVDIIEWLDASRDTMVWRFPRYQNEIKNGAKLVVRESQAAVFVNEGQIADVFTPGTYDLETKNLPILSTLKGWKYGFDSPFKAEVYFVTTRLFTDLKWGTQNPIPVRDKEFGVVRLRAFGAYAVRVVDPGAFVKELVGTDPQFRTEEVGEYLRQMVVSRLSNALASAGIPLLDIAASTDQLGSRLAGILSEDARSMGLEFPRFIIENVSAPPEVEAALDKRTQMGVLGNLDEYTKFQAANALEEAAKNPGGGAGEGIGLGMGMAMGQRMAESMRTPSAQPAAQQAPQAQTGPAAGAGPVAGPPPLPAATAWYLGSGGTRSGPYDDTALVGEVAAGRLTAQTLVWKAGMGDWAAASTLPELAGVLASSPPPLPPQG